MITRVWLQLCHFSATYGIQHLWHSTDFHNFISNPKDKSKLLTVFPNFACSIIVQGHETTEGLHGPFTVRDVFNVTSYVHVFTIHNNDPDLPESESIFFLILYMSNDTAQLIDNHVRERLNHLLQDWSKSFHDNRQLNEEKMVRLQKMLDQFIQQETTAKSMDMNINGVKTTLMNSLVSLNEHINRLREDISITLWSKNQVARFYNILVFQSLQEATFKHMMITTRKINEHYPFTYLPRAWLTHDEMHTLLRINRINILAVEELTSVYFLPSQCYIFFITPEVNIPSFLKEIGKNVDWENVIRVFFLIQEDSRKKIATMRHFCHVLEQYHPNIKKATTINVSWIKKDQIIPLFHVFNDLIVESVLHYLSGQ